MIVGCFLRNYKTYGKIFYIPISHGENLTAYVGDNGVGKSSILEALNAYFNLKKPEDWNVNNKYDSQPTSEPFIAPVFLIQKNGIEDKYTNICTLLSNSLWGNSLSKVSSHQAYKSYGEHLEQLKNSFNPDEYYLLFFPKRYIKKANANAELFYFNDQQSTQIGFEEYKTDYDNLDNIVSGRYRYIYIPTEVKEVDYAKMVNGDIQSLATVQLDSEMSNVFDKQTLIKINKELDTIVSSINTAISPYNYTSAYKKKLTLNDLKSKVIEAFFESKDLFYMTENNKKTSISDLSAGEKKQALLSIIASMVKSNYQSYGQRIILAIDEPESSADTSSCYDQFERIGSISSYIQVLFTTHWYGFMPIIQKGNAHFISKLEDGQAFDSYDLSKMNQMVKQVIRKTKNSEPHHAKLKGYMDLCFSIFTSLSLQEPYNWVICEGSSDAIYLKHFLTQVGKQKLQNVDSTRLCLI